MFRFGAKEKGSRVGILARVLLKRWTTGKEASKEKRQLMNCEKVERSTHKKTQ